VTEHIETHLDRPLTIGELADLCSLSPFHFARAFRRSVGKPPHAFVTERRIAAAERLIRGTDASITQIALEVGYGAASHFARAFRQAKGVSPSGLRRRLEPHDRR
jgi:AraC family transcriptional regulator